MTGKATGHAALTPDRLAFVARARTATLATIADDGSPRLVPICFVIGDDHVLWSPLDEKPKQTDDPRELARVRDILGRPQVSLLVDRWDEDWSRLAWVRLGGEARLVEPGEAPLDVIDGLGAKYPQYADHDLAHRPLIKVHLTRATSWGELGD